MCDSPERYYNTFRLYTEEQNEGFSLFLREKTAFLQKYLMSAGRPSGYNPYLRGSRRQDPSGCRGCCLVPRSRFLYNAKGTHGRSAEYPSADP